MFPIGWFFHFCIRGKQLRHFVNILFGTLGMAYFFGREIWHVFAMTGITWLLLACTPRNKSQKYVSLFVFGFLSTSQIAVVIYHFGSFDLEVTTHTMLLTLRLQALAWSYYDAGRKQRGEKITPR